MLEKGTLFKRAGRDLRHKNKFQIPNTVEAQPGLFSSERTDQRQVGTESRQRIELLQPVFQPQIETRFFKLRKVRTRKPALFHTRVAPALQLAEKILRLQINHRPRWQQSRDVDVRAGCLQPWQGKENSFRLRRLQAQQATRAPVEQNLFRNALKYSPLTKGVRGLSFIFSNPSFNRTQHIPNILLHIQIVKSQNMNSHLLQILLSLQILREAEPMTFTVNLDRQLQLRAVEIDDEVMDRLLSHELIAKHFSPLQMVPKQNLCKGAVVSEIPGALLQVSAVEDFQDNPLTPFSKGEYRIKLDKRFALEDIPLALNEPRVDCRPAFRCRLFDDLEAPPVNHSPLTKGAAAQRRRSQSDSCRAAAWGLC